MSIPKGYKLVPVEPTEEMLVVMHDRILIGVNSKKREANILNDKAWWAAVVDSAPTQPQPIYDEAKERELFEAEITADSQEAGFGEPDLHREVDGTYRQAHYQSAWGGWIRCAQSRAKAGEVGHE